MGLKNLNNQKFHIGTSWNLPNTKPELRCINCILTELNNFILHGELSWLSCTNLRFDGLKITCGSFLPSFLPSLPFLLITSSVPCLAALSWLLMGWHGADSALVHQVVSLSRFFYKFNLVLRLRTRRDRRWLRILPGIFFGGRWVMIRYRDSRIFDLLLILIVNDILSLFCELLY